MEEEFKKIIKDRISELEESAGNIYGNNELRSEKLEKAEFLQKFYNNKRIESVVIIANMQIVVKTAHATLKLKKKSVSYSVH